MPRVRHAFLVGGTHSGCGKTTVSLGLMAALTRRGLIVQPAKCGPDFIDPTLHQAVCGRPSINLDPWLCGREWTRRSFVRLTEGAQVVAVEGVMGLFDGGEGSAATLAKTLRLPVVLVVDAGSAAESVAAMVKGFSELDPEVAVAGVVCNRVGSDTHRRLINDALARHCRVPALGFLPPQSGFELPSRHLGLLLGNEQGLTGPRLELMADLLEKHVDIDKLLRRCPVPADNKITGQWGRVIFPPPAAPARTRLAVALDEAFCFYYRENFALLQQYGTELVFFSPLKDTGLPPEVDGIYLGGGYPELYAEELTKNRAMRERIRGFALHGGSIYAECGGLIYCCSEIVDQECVVHPMAGIFPARAVMEKKRRALGYRQATTLKKSIFGPAGTVLRGHEFHYSRIENMPETVERIYTLSDKYGKEQGREGFCLNNCLGSYVHLHFGSYPAAAACFASALAGEGHDNDG